MGAIRILLRKAAQQLGLFDMPVQVDGYVRDDGTYVAPHTARRHKRMGGDEKAAPNRQGKESPLEIGDAVEFADANGGTVRAKVVGTTDPVAVVLSVTDAPEGSRWKPGARAAKQRASLMRIGKDAGTESAAPAGEKIVEHVTGRGKTLRGVVRDGVTADQAKEIDPYAFRKDGGWFIRDKHLAGGAPGAAAKKPAKTAAPDAREDDLFAQVQAETLEPFGVPAGTSKAERRRLNTAAAERAVELMAGRNTLPELSPEDAALLRQYTGTGGIGDSLNEFYTRPDVAAAMWQVVGALTGGRMPEVLEPCCGTGVFLHTAPAGSHVTGVEMDGTSGGIASLLHQRHQVQVSAFEDFATGDDRQFDAVVGNVPFGLRGALIKKDKSDLKTAEQYFVDAALDKTRAGGVVALVVPTGIMDGKNTRAFRERLLKKGEFVTAFRMPNTAFEAAHTEVTTDIVVFRKRPDDVAGALGTVDRQTMEKLGLWDKEFVSGTFFQSRGIDHVFGRPEDGWRARAGMGNDFTVTGSMEGVAEAIGAWRPEQVAAGPAVTVTDVLGALGDDEAAKTRARGGAIKAPYRLGRAGDTKVVDGILYVLQGEPPRWHRAADDAKFVADARSIAGTLHTLAEAVAAGKPADGLRERVKEMLDAYIEEHGDPHASKDLAAAARSYPEIWRLLGAVRKNGDGYSDLVQGRDADREEKTDNFAAAVARATGAAEDADSFTPEQVAAQWAGGDLQATLDHLMADDAYAVTPDTGAWQTRDNYLAGELYPKLDALRAALARDDLDAAFRAKYEAQAKALEATIDPQSLEDVEAQLNSGWVPLDVVADFFNARNAASSSQYVRNREPTSITFANGVFKVTSGDYSTGLLEKYLNRTGLREKDQPVIDEWNAAFKEWLLTSPHRDAVEDAYNRAFRGYRAKAFSDRPMDVPGLAPQFDVNAYHWSSLRWALAAGKGIIADNVGLGKTLRGMMLSRLLVANGRAKKPLIVVPKSVLANWVAEANAWFPGSSVMVIGETYSRDKAGELVGKPDSAAERNRKLHDLAQNDYDFAFISIPAWNELDLSPEKKNAYIENDFWTQRADQLDQAGDKRVRKIRESYDQQVASRDFEKRTDALNFEDLGVDALILDEGHAFKNLVAARSRFGEQPKFLGGQGLSNRALDTNLKTQQVRDANDGKNVFILTATPTRNSPLEIYSMLSHVAPEEFTKRGIKNSEEFLDRYCEFTRDKVLGVDGEIADALVTSGFKNMDELRAVMSRYMQRRTAEDVGLPLPRAETETVLVDMSPAQQAVYAELRDAAAKAGGRDDTGDAHIFSIMDKMGKAAIDLRLLGHPDEPDEPSPKLTKAADNIAALSKEGGQVVFADHIDLHERLADMLVARGMRRDEIGIVNAKAASSSAKRQNIQDRFNAGKIKVVIGNTATMGEGLNLQKRTSDIHHLELPWEPASIQQRNGRGLRQGNKREAVRLHTYLSKGSFDGYRYQTLTAKRDWQDLLWNGGNRIENLAREGVFDRNELMIMLSADPDAERAKVAADRDAAMGRAAAEGRAQAAAEFVRFADMSRSLRNLPKGASSTGRLEAHVAAARTRLKANPHFTDKAALDNPEGVFVHPATGHAWRAGTAFTVDPKVSAVSGYSQRASHWLVTAVEPRDGTIRARPYGSNIAFDFDAKALSGGITPAVYDKAADDKAVSDALAGQIGGPDMNTPAKLVGVDPQVLRERFHDVQAGLKEALRTYKASMSLGAGMVKDGEPVFAQSFEVRQKLDDHDLMLPIPEHRTLAIHGWMKAEREKRPQPEYRATRSRNNYGGNPPIGVSFAYFGVEKKNPWDAVIHELFGESAVEEARQALVGAVIAESKGEDFATSLKRMVPAVQQEKYSVRASWPAAAVAALLERATPEDLTREIGNTLAMGRVHSGLYTHGVPSESAPSQSDHVGVALAKMAIGAGDYRLAIRATREYGSASGADTKTTLHSIMRLVNMVPPGQRAAMAEAVSMEGLKFAKQAGIEEEQYPATDHRGGPAGTFGEVLERMGEKAASHGREAT